MKATPISSYVGKAAWHINGFTLDLTFDDLEATNSHCQMQLFITQLGSSHVQITGKTRDVPLDLGEYRRNNDGVWVYVPDTSCLMEQRAVEAIATRIDNWLG